MRDQLGLVGLSLSWLRRCCFDRSHGDGLDGRSVQGGGETDPKLVRGGGLLLLLLTGLLGLGGGGYGEGWGLSCIELVRLG